MKSKKIRHKRAATPAAKLAPDPAFLSVAKRFRDDGGFAVVKRMNLRCKRDREVNYPDRPYESVFWLALRQEDRREYLQLTIQSKIPLNFEEGGCYQLSMARIEEPDPDWPNEVQFIQSWK